MLTKRQAFQLLTLLLVLVWSVALAGIGAWVWVSLAQNGNQVVKGTLNDENSNSSRSVTSADSSAKLYGKWMVVSKGTLPATVNQELEKVPETHTEETENEMERAIGGLVSSFKGFVKTVPEPGSFLLTLKKNRTYELSERSGIFLNPDFENLGPSGNWTFNEENRRLILIPSNMDTGFKIQLTVIEKDHLIGQSFGARNVEFVRQQ